MNKLLYIFLLLFLLQNTVKSQSYTLSWEGIELEEEVLITGNPEDEELLCNINITNNSNEVDSIKVKRVLIDLAEEANHLMCWGSCYPPNSDSVFISHLYIVLQPGETSADHEFSGHYLPNGTEDVSKVEYTFFNMNDESERATVTVNYNTLATSLTEGFNDKMECKVFPNPVSNYLKIESDVVITNIEFYNLTGQLVKTIVGESESQMINVSNFEKGVFLVKVYSHEEVITRRIIIE